MAHRVGDVGTTFRARVLDDAGEALDISTASTITFLWGAPDGTTVDSHTASLTNDGTDGLCEYVTSAAADLDQAGEWRWQVKVDFGTNEWHTGVVKFKVESVLS